MRYFLGEIAAKLTKRMEKLLYILRQKVGGNSNTIEIDLVRPCTQVTLFSFYSSHVYY